MTRTLLMLSLLAVPALAFADDRPDAQDRSASSDQRVFELRTYSTNPGKLDALNRRFREHTNRIFKKHGMEIVGVWTSQDEKEEQEGNGGKPGLPPALPHPRAPQKTGGG